MVSAVDYYFIQEDGSRFKVSRGVKRQLIQTGYCGQSGNDTDKEHSLHNLFHCSDKPLLTFLLSAGGPSLQAILLYCD